MMKKMLTMVAVMLMVSGVALGDGMNMKGQSGGVLIPDAMISQRLSVGMSYLDLDKDAEVGTAIGIGLADRFEVSYARQDNLVNVVGVKMGISGKEDGNKAAIAVGVVGENMDIEDVFNKPEVYVAAQIGIKQVDAIFVVRSEDIVSGRDYLFAGGVGIPVAEGWKVNGEFKQNSTVKNQWSGFLSRNMDNAVLKAGVVGVADENLNSQFFLSATIFGI